MMVQLHKLYNNVECNSVDNVYAVIVEAVY